MKNDRKSSDDTINCSHCNALLPAHVKFCSSCGEQVEQQKNEEMETHAKLSSDEAQEQETQTICLESFPQRYLKLKRLVSYQSQKNNNETGLLQGSSPSIQGTEEAPTQSLSSLQEMASTDEKVLLVAPIQNERVQDSPTMPTPSIPEPQEKVSTCSNLLWPTIIILSAIGAGLVNFVFTGLAIRPIIVFWFLCVCPGMMVVRFLRLKEPVVEWTLAIAVSFAIDALVAGIQLYAGKWSPAATLTILIILSICGAIVQLATKYSFTHLLLRVAISQINKVFRSIGVVLKLYLVNPLYKGLSKIKDLAN